MPSVCACELYTLSPSLVVALLGDQKKMWAELGIYSLVDG